MLMAATFIFSQRNSEKHMDNAQKDLIVHQQTKLLK